MLTKIYDYFNEKLYEFEKVSKNYNTLYNDDYEDGYNGSELLHVFWTGEEDVSEIMISETVIKWGSRGGSCWDNYLEHYDNQSYDDNFMLDFFIEYIIELELEEHPNREFNRVMIRNKISDLIIEEESSEDGYYGNYSSTEVHSIKMSDIIEVLELERLYEL